LHRGESKKTGNKKSGVDEGVKNAMQSQSLIIALDARRELAVEVNPACSTLEAAEPAAEKKRAQGDPDMPGCEPLL
jgi:hypothetical protein